MRTDYEFSSDGRYTHATVTIVSEVVERFKRIFRRAGTRTHSVVSVRRFVLDPLHGFDTMNWYEVPEGGVLRKAGAGDCVDLSNALEAQQLTERLVNR